VAGRPLIKILDAASAEPLLVLRGLDQIHAHDAGFNPRVRFSPDGRSLAAICHDGPTSLSLWGLEEHQAKEEQSRSLRRRAVVRHLHEAGACSQENNRAALLSHLDQLRTRSLVGPWEYWRRGWLRTQAGRWLEAAGDFVQALRSPQGKLDSGLSAESGQGP
jgi:hypothetical protein